jgi:hypothetical protein
VSFRFSYHPDRLSLTLIQRPCIRISGGLVVAVVFVASVFAASAFVPSTDHKPRLVAVMDHQFTSNQSISVQLLVANRDTVQSRTRLLPGRDDRMCLIQPETPS